MSRRPTSSLAACVWIPLFPLRCEEARHEGLAAYPTALLAPDTTRKLWQVSSLARHVGVKPGMTVSQAIGLCPTLRLIEPDPIHYDERFAHLLSALSEVSPSGHLIVPLFDWVGEWENSPLGSRPAAPSRAKRLLCQPVQNRSFSLPNPSPCCRSTAIHIAGSVSSASAPSVHSPRFPKRRSPRSSATSEDDCGASPPAASRSQSKAASHPSRSSPRSPSSHRSASASCSCIRSSS